MCVWGRIYLCETYVGGMIYNETGIYGNRGEGGGGMQNCSCDVVKLGQRWM